MRLSSNWPIMSIWIKIVKLIKDADQRCMYFLHHVWVNYLKKIRLFRNSWCTGISHGDTFSLHNIIILACIDCIYIIKGTKYKSKFLSLTIQIHLSDLMLCVCNLSRVFLSSAAGTYWYRKIGISYNYKFYIITSVNY